MPDQEQTTQPQPRDRAAWVVALAFILVTLAALVAIPVLVQREVDDLRSDIEASEPARTLLMGLQYNLLREMSALNQHAVSTDTQYAKVFREARTTEERLWRELGALTINLGPNVHEHFVKARTIAEMWHERLDEEALLRRSNPSPSLQALEVRQRFEEVLTATASLDSVIVSTTASNRADITRAENRGLFFTFVSGVLALVAAVAVAMLVMRIRRLADESERRRRETVAALAQSARAAEARHRLLRGITHDVKNPLGAARGYAELLGMGVKGPLHEEQQKLVAGVERSIDSALAIISDLLDLARTDSGGVVVQRVNVDLNEVARQAVEDHRAAAQTAGHDIRAESATERLDSYTDPARVRQVLDNLISNAIKYTPAPGRIVIRTDADADDAPFGQHAVAIRVSDNGPGIPENQRESIFDEFTRIDDGNRMKGHGLGLAIARRMARLLDGELGLVHDDAPGSTFTLWLPQREEAGAKAN